MIADNEPPLYRNWLTAARWIPETPHNSDLRSFLLSDFVRLIQDENLTLAMRSRFAAVFALTGEAASVKMFKALLGSGSPTIRRISLLGLGSIGNPAFIHDMLNLLADQSIEVRNTACLAIGALPGETVAQTLIDVMMQGDEDLRQTAAETLVQRSELGKQALEAALHSEDLLARRAAILGIAQERGEWAQKILEKVAVEDGQWVVRNAALQGLDDLKQPLAPQLLPMPAASECGWIIAFAGTLGLGIRPGDSGIEILINAVKMGSEDEKIAALKYLRRETDEGIAGVLYNLLYAEHDESLKSHIILTLLCMSAAGVKLPPPIKFGLG